MALILAPMIGDSTETTPAQEACKAIISVSEILTLYWLFSKKPTGNDQSSFVYQVSLGWAAAETILGYLFYFIYGASGDERDWSYLMEAAGANF